MIVVKIGREGDWDEQDFEGPDFEGQSEEERAITWLCGMFLIDWQGHDLDQFVKYINDHCFDGERVGERVEVGREGA